MQVLVYGTDTLPVLMVPGGEGHEFHNLSSPLPIDATDQIWSK